MLNASGIVCNSKTAATAALETIAGTYPRGTHRAALLAVIDWIENNMPADFTEETKARIQKIFDENFDEAAFKARKWEVCGGEPEHGTRCMVPFLFNANTKTWELENEMPPVWTEPNPNILPQTEGYESEEDDPDR